MALIYEKQILEMRNVLCFRGKVDAQEANTIALEMKQYVLEKGMQIEGRVVSTTYAVEKRLDGVKMDVEILMPMIGNMDVLINDKYYHKPIFKLYDALKITHEGDLRNVQESAELLLQFATDNKVIPITTVYNVSYMSNSPAKSKNNGLVDMYLGVSYNVI